MLLVYMARAVGLESTSPARLITSISVYDTMCGASPIMLLAVRAEWVVQLGDKIRDYNEAYGHKVWPLLYQCYDRFLEEQAPRILRRETLKLNLAIQQGRNIMGEGLDVKQPLNWIFELIVGDDNRGAAEDRWWCEHSIGKWCQS